MFRFRRLAVLVLLLAGCGRNDTEAQSHGAANERAGARSADTASTNAIEIPELTTADFTSAVSSSSYMLLEFGGKSCKPCRQMQGTLKAVKARYPRLGIANIYMEHSRDLLAAWKIQLIPTQVILGPGARELERHVGLWELDDLLAALDKHGIPR